MTVRLNLFIAIVVLACLSETAESCDTVIDLCFILDSSQSTCATDPNYKKGNVTCGPWAAMLNFAKNIVSNMTIGDGMTRVAMDRCYTKGQRVWNLTRGNDLAKLVPMILGMNYSAGSTNMSGALDVADKMIYALQYGDDPTIPNVCLVIWDGDSMDPAATQASGDALRAAGVTIYVIGKQGHSEAALQQLSSDPKQLNQNYFLVDKFENLMQQAYDLVMQQLCQYSC